MSYYREVKVEELIDWLMTVDYENASPEELAIAILKKYDVLGSSSTPN